MRAGIAFGSNVGDRLAHLQCARAEVLALAQLSGPILASPVYETEPVGMAPGAAAFLNAVMEVEFAGNPLSLLPALGAIEARLGRNPQRPQNAPRTIDLDLLYLSDFVISTDETTIPHPRLHLRRFVLQPLADIRPELVLPGHDLPTGALLAALKDRARVELFAETWER